MTFFNAGTLALEIRQWGVFVDLTQGSRVSFPISFSSSFFTVMGTDMASTSGSIQGFGFYNTDSSGFNAVGSISVNRLYGRYIATGK